MGTRIGRWTSELRFASMGVGEIMNYDGTPFSGSLPVLTGLYNSEDFAWLVSRDGDWAFVWNKVTNEEASNSGFVQISNPSNNTIHSGYTDYGYINEPMLDGVGFYTLPAPFEYVGSSGVPSCVDAIGTDTQVPGWSSVPPGGVGPVGNYCVSEMVYYTFPLNWSDTTPIPQDLGGLVDAGWYYYGFVVDGYLYFEIDDPDDEEYEYYRVAVSSSTAAYQRFFTGFIKCAEGE